MRVAVVVGSEADLQIMEGCTRVLDELGIPHLVRVYSAHRTPEEAAEFVRSLPDRGVKVLIAAAGLAAHLPGVAAAQTRLPVIGVPLAVGPLAGVDALLSMAQMPGGVPVAAVGIGEAGAMNAAILAARILALTDGTVAARIDSYMEAKRKKILDHPLNRDDRTA